MIDLMSAARGAVFRALLAAVPGTLAAVYDDVPEDTQPPFLKVGAIDTTADAKTGEQYEQLTLEVVAIYRGADRGKLLAMMHAARIALDRKTLTTDTAVLQCRFATASASDASAEDGVTYAGILNIDILAEPA